MNLHQRLSQLEQVIKPNKDRLSTIFVQWAIPLNAPTPDPDKEAGILMITNEQGNGTNSYHLTNAEYAEYKASDQEPSDWIKTTNIPIGHNRGLTV